VRPIRASTKAITSKNIENESLTARKARFYLDSPNTGQESEKIGLEYPENDLKQNIKSANNEVTESSDDNDRLGSSTIGSTKEIRVVILLLTMKVKNVKSLRSDKKAVKEAIEKVVELVQLWPDKGNIAGVVDFDKIIRREDYEEIEY